MHKIVNGIRIELTPEEEKSVLEEWERNKKRKEEKRKILQEKKELRISAINKLKTLGLSDDEINSIIK